MTPHSSDFADLYRVWLRIRNKMNVMESLPHDFGVDVRLHLSEIHTIQAIGTTPENNIRTIAEILGVTPSAASQTITKLTKRGLVKKVRGLRNEKEVTLELTEKGQTAFQNHERLHAEMYERIASGIGPLNEKELEVIDRVFSAMESVYDQRIRELSAGAKEKQKERLA